MSDAPLSRRARRTFEEEAADRAASQDPTVALRHGLASGEHDEADTDTAAISRRDRRRMERFAHPLEAWTAEEEMLATGQIPAMTPERIAEQEWISREKAAMAAEASQEFRRLAESEIRQTPAMEFESPSVEAPVFEAPAFEEPAFEAPVFEAPAFEEPAFEAPAFEKPAAEWPREPAYEAPEAPPEWARQAPVDVAPVDQPAWAQEAPASFPGDSEANPELPAARAWPEQSWSEQSFAPVEASPAQAPPEFALPAPARPDDAFEESESGARDGAEAREGHHDGAHANRPAIEPYQPVMALDDEPLVRVVHPVHDETLVAADPDVVDAPVAERPNIFDALFPPGSSQSMLRHQDPFANGSPEGSVPVPSGALPTLLPPQEVPARAINAADEMRRLAAEAMSGIEKAAKADEAAAAAALAANSSTALEFDSLPPASSPVAPLAQQGPSAGGPLSEFSWPTQGGNGPSAGPANADPNVASVGDMSWGSERAPGTPPEGLAPHYAEFDQLTQPRSAGPASGQFPTQGQQLSPPSGQFPTQGLPGPQGPAWTSYPPNPAQGGAVDPNDYTPISNAPTPDFSSLYQQSSPSAFPPVTGSINTAGFNTNDPTATGQLAAVRRPDLPEVGGAKHFKWLHLAVIGALMFVLGVVIYNAAFAS